MSNGYLTEQEQALLSKLGECFNDWCALSGHHPMDQQEFASAIHRLQDMVGTRAAARAHPNLLPFVLYGEEPKVAKRSCDTCWSHSPADEGDPNEFCLSPDRLETDIPEERLCPAWRLKRYE